MAGLGEVASVIAVLQLSGKVVDYVGKVKDASEDRKRLRDEIRACKRILQEIKDDADDSQESDGWVDTIKTLERPDGPLPRLQSALIQVETRLRKGDTFRGSLKWPFQERDVIKIIDTIDREKSLLSLALSRDSGRLLHKIKACAEGNNKQLATMVQNMSINSQNAETNFHNLTYQVADVQVQATGLQNGIDRLRNNEDVRNTSTIRRAILLWLMSYDHAAKHHDIISRRQEGTGNWLLASDEFGAWLNNSGSRTLLCTGLPGAGKTMLASIVIDDLQGRYHTNTSVGVAYIYCDYRTRKDQTIEFMVLSLLKQLVEQQDPLSAGVMQLYTSHDYGGRRPLFRDLVRCLQSVAACLSRVFIVIDALDECQVSNGCRSILLAEINELQKISNTSVLVTTRHIPEILERFSMDQAMEIRATTDDVRMFIEGNLHGLPNFVQRNPKLMEQIKAQIAESVDGMFLLAKLYLGALSNKRSPNAIRGVLNKISDKAQSKGLPTESEIYDQAYEMAMHRIEEQGPDQAELAREILSWVTYATRSLDAYQLREALAVRPGDYDFDEDNCPDIQDMVSSCAGLVTIDEGTHIVRLVHYTAQRYFDRMRHQLFPDADAMIAHTCITYLSFSMFRSSPSRIDGQRIQDRSGEWHWVKFEELPFQFNGRSPEALFSYAANCWGHHAHHAPSKDAQVVDFLRDPPNIQALGVAIDRDFSDLKSPPDPLKGGSTIGLHLAAYFGLEAVAAALLQHGSDPNTRTKLGYTPLMLAALNGHESIVSLLLNNRAMVGLTDQAYCTAVHHAAGSGRDSIIRLLLSKNTIGDSVQQLSAYQTQLLLHMATRGCHETTVELLLDSLGGVKGLSERSAPLHATRAGYVHTYAVQILRDANAETDQEARRDTSPLYNAVLRGNAAMVKLLLDHGAPVDVGGNKQGAYSTPLQQAAHKGDVEIVRLLLQAGAKPDPDVTFYYSPPALHASITHKEDAMVRLLVEAGADVNRNYASGHSPLYEAAKQDWEGGVKLLLSLGADINFQLKRGNNTLDLFLHEKPVADTAVMYAARSGDATAMKLLLHHGADAHLRNNRGESALDLAKDRLAKEMESSNAPREDTNVDTSMSRRRKIVPTECRECIRLLVERGAT